MIKIVHGKLLSIFIAQICGPSPPPAGGHGEVHPMKEVNEVEAVEDKGLLGDRWFDIKQFQFSDGRLKSFSHSRQVSLINVETIKELQKSFQIKAIDLRRNLLIEGIDLEKQVGSKIQIGNIVIEGSGLCHSCKHIEDVTQSGVQKLLYDMGGLRAKVIQGGVIYKGDKICLLG